MGFSDGLASVSLFVGILIRSDTVSQGLTPWGPPIRSHNEWGVGG